MQPLLRSNPSIHPRSSSGAYYNGEINLSPLVPFGAWRRRKAMFFFQTSPYLRNAPACRKSSGRFGEIAVLSVFFLFYFSLYVCGHEALVDFFKMGLPFPAALPFPPPSLLLCLSRLTGIIFSCEKTIGFIIYQVIVDMLFWNCSEYPGGAELLLQKGYIFLVRNENVSEKYFLPMLSPFHFRENAKQELIIH